MLKHQCAWFNNDPKMLYEGVVTKLIDIYLNQDPKTLSTNKIYLEEINVFWCRLCQNRIILSQTGFVVMFTSYAQWLEQVNQWLEIALNTTESKKMHYQWQCGNQSCKTTKLPENAVFSLLNLHFNMKMKEIWKSFQKIKTWRICFLNMPSMVHSNSQGVKYHQAWE